ncbi:MAG: phosphonate metabolism protein/1,5-bisphosphokinase (PRPP-forming) PhnN [Phyllobacteriaceae bacterium]|nr:phosphonate metabolism protein/1,5-bisphosphokinase (PRPP-forming) PhnN [Phyllobacteriaceae bacterium]
MPEPQGRLFVVVGPSGSGKDSLIAWLKQALPAESAVRFVRRTITRPADAGGEDHAAMTPADFEAARTAGRFCLIWQAHGLSYGVPADLVGHVRQGGIAILNGSRHALADLFAVFPDARVISIHVEPIELKRRLAGRGRENAAAIAGRLGRHDGGLGNHPVHAIIDNSGSLDAAGQALLSLIDPALAARRSKLLPALP